MGFIQPLKGGNLFLCDNIDKHGRHWVNKWNEPGPEIPHELFSCSIYES